VHAVVGHHVHHVLKIDKRIVNPNYFDFRILNGCPEDQTADTSKPLIPTLIAIEIPPFILYVN
jgi:hypothetical protein